MKINRIATTQINNTNVHLARDEFENLLLLTELWEQPENPGPHADSNCYVIELNHPIQAKLSTIDRKEKCSNCGTENNFIYISTGYLETDPSYFRSHGKEKLCKDCAEKPKETLLKAQTELSEHILAITL